MCVSRLIYQRETVVCKSSVNNLILGLGLRAEIYKALGNDELAHFDRTRWQELFDIFSKMSEEGYAYINSGEYEKAIAHANSQLAIKPDDDIFLFIRAIASYHLKRYDDAMNDANAIIKNGLGDETTRLLIVWILKDQKKYEEAIAFLAQMIESDSDYIPYYLERINGYYETKEFELAEKDVATVAHLCSEQKPEIGAEYRTGHFVWLGSKFLKEKQARSAIGLFTIAKDFAVAREQSVTESVLSQILAEIQQQLDEDGQIKETNEFQTFVKRISNLENALLSQLPQNNANR